MNDSLQPAAPRRSNLMERFPDSLILVRGRGPGGLNPNFFYLTGLTEPSGVLALGAAGLRVETGRDYPGPDYVRGKIVRQVLFLPERDPLAARWGEDAEATCGEVSTEAAGVDAVLPVNRFEPLLSAWLQHTKQLSYVRPAPPNVTGPDGDAPFVQSIRERFLNVEFHDATAAVASMRAVKDAAELAAIERAVDVTADGFDRVLSTLKPGLMEHRLEAELAAAYRSAGAEHGFDPIVGAGPRGLELHYRANAGTIEQGDLVLVDSGARLHGYGADVTRTFPASGKFSARQAELYEIVLAAQQATIDAVRPGVLLGDLHAIAWESIAAAGFGSAFVHGTSHHLGIETHDAGDVHEPLQAGAVVTVEPGVYLEDEAVGIRIEDDVAVVPDGARVLTSAIPKTVEAIERRMAAR